MKLKKSPLLFLVTLALSAPAAHAVHHWKGTSGAFWASNVNWTTANNTTNAAAAPGASDDVVFNRTAAGGSTAINGAMNIPLGNGVSQAAKSITFTSTGTVNISGTSSGTTNRTLTIGSTGVAGSGGVTKDLGSGTASFNGGSGLGTLTVSVGVSQTWTNNSVTALNLGTTFTSGTSTSAILSLGTRTLTLAGTGDFQFGTATTSNSVIGVSVGSTIDKGGAGKLTIGGNNDFAGTTMISGGTLALLTNTAIDNSPTIIVGASTTFDVSAVTGGYTLGASQTLSGTGNVTGAMTVAGTLSPGNSPGIMTTGSQTWVNGADYNFQMLNATGAAGTGFDQIQITGTLDLSGLTTAGFTINLLSLASIAPDVSGNAANFNNTIDQSWAILTTSGGITGFDASDFSLNIGGFTNALGSGSFFVSSTGSNLMLNYTAVPEPGPALLGGLGLLALLRRRR